MGIAGWLLLRPLLRRAPKFVVCLLWGLAGVRLLLPIRLESVLSLIPRAEPISPSTAPGGTTPRIDTGIPALDSGINGALTSLAPQPTASADPLGTLLPVVALIWIIGVFAMLSFALISYLRLRKKTGITVPYADGVLLCDNIGTPFILGISARGFICRPERKIWRKAQRKRFLRTNAPTLPGGISSGNRSDI